MKKTGNTIQVTTQDNEKYTFGLLFSVADCFRLMEQLSKITMVQMIHDPISNEKIEALPQIKNQSNLCRDLSIL
jgi:hypothetical protein